MTTAYLCVLIAVFLPYFFVGYAKMAGPGFTNKNVRDFLLTLEGKRKRAYWAHLNQFESFPSFAAAVIIAHQLHGDPFWINALAIGYLFFRVLFFIFYLADKNSLRSLVWLGSVICTVSLFICGFKG
jgi:uncharacterized MAPEG superfamily protein